ncbi:heavy metal translocating P-type ATPase metal-binding domain-containing protein [Aquimarina sp. MMG015]|uniref:heavy metal translocating P-type ATPase n=1 Tax=Aquimarina sp. MMG015 TaxID=2822689 RepID=UPI001B3A1501|nr:heavy metal translocating P-type ATPase metal-binding domain-containing protein [Aquimarina sp. MMG015]MBQ4802951.1 heavy metal translocating P-type ATPase metal-binding domain-containing protein [Aquimarina sp. MMG015]
MIESTCYHCGSDCDAVLGITYDQKTFCCNGCKTVYDIFSSNNLDCYYDLQSAPGNIPKEIEKKYNYLDTISIAEKLIEFSDDTTAICTLYIPDIHCSSCIWVLENLHKLEPSIINSQVNFPKKTVRITFNKEKSSLKKVIILLNSIGYEPYISLDDYSEGKKNNIRSLIYKLGIAGFAFGNVMFLSFPEYFEVSEYWLEQYKHVFRWLMFAFSLPVVFYAAQDYFISAYKGLKSKILNIDVPIALGIAVLFIRSTSEIIFDLGTGFFDSLTGLVFFLLLGKFFQQKTYSFLSFERDYKSYFPIAVTRLVRTKNNKKYIEEGIQLYDIKEGDRLLIRNEELIPVDAVLIKGRARIDYSFVTGESEWIDKVSGDKLFAGGKQLYGAIEIEATKTIEQSYLTSLWSNDVFKKDKSIGFTNLTDAVSKYFTLIILSIAVITTLFWFFIDVNKAINVFTAVLIIACPCALALARPFALGNMLRIFGKNKFYLRNADVIERLAQMDSIIFDKTGTITTNTESNIEYQGVELTSEEESLLKNSLRASNHPLSRALYKILEDHDIYTLDEYQEHIGKGIEAKISESTIKIGSSNFVGNNQFSETQNTNVHISTNDKYKGRYVFHNQYRKNIKNVFDILNSGYKLSILSGDNEGEREHLKNILPEKTTLKFNHKPDDKLDYIKSLQESGQKVIMIGDGLNDAGALAQSNVGIAISENVNVFSPACDAILDASQFDKIPQYLIISRKTMKVIKSSFVLSFLYNVIGLYFAVTGQLSPIVAAILMPLSSISVIIYVTILTNYIGRKIKLKQ